MNIFNILRKLKSENPEPKRLIVPAKPSVVTRRSFFFFGAMAGVASQLDLGTDPEYKTWSTHINEDDWLAPHRQPFDIRTTITCVMISDGAAIKQFVTSKEDTAQKRQEEILKKLRKELTRKGGVCDPLLHDISVAYSDGMRLDVQSHINRSEKSMKALETQIKAVGRCI